MKEKRVSYSIPDEVLHWLTLKAVGKLGETESEKLNRWMHENPEAGDDCASFTDKVKKTQWTYLSNNIADPKMLVENLLPVKTDNRTGNRRIFHYLAYAASLLILAGFLWYFLYQSEKTEIVTTQHEAPALERQNRALLVLSDGTSLELDKSGSTEMTGEGGVKITNLPGEILRYEQEAGSDDQTRMNRLIVPAGARYQLQLSDGTKVWMNSESELEYPVSFAANHRSVKLSGEAFFEVKENKNAPFKIEANGYEVVVYGTSLNISAYANDSFIQTTLVTGALEVNSREGDTFRLDPGQMAMISHNDQKTSISNVDTKLYTSWRDGILYFHRISLKELAIKLERWYDVEILFESEQKSGLLFSGAMENSRDIRFLLKLIGQAANVEFEIDEKQIYVK